VLVVSEPDALGPWDPVSRLVGVGPKIGAKLAAAGVTRVVDLILHLPHRYEDRTQVVSLERPPAQDSWVVVRGTVRSVSARRAARRRMRIVTGIVDDGHGTIDVVWFNQPWVEKRLAQADLLSLYGPVRRRRGSGLELVNPEITDVEQGDEQGVVPVYPALGGLGGTRLRARRLCRSFAGRGAFPVCVPRSSAMPAAPPHAGSPHQRDRASRVRASDECP
jgi:ATP-dependent DNA helicase RecG